MPELEIRSRIKEVDRAVKTDPACKGKARLALQMLADETLADVPAGGIISLLKATSPEVDWNRSGDTDAGAWGRAAARTYGNNQGTHH